MPLIVVPNTELLDDHQTEMAEHLAREGYATHSKCTYVSLFFIVRITQETKGSLSPYHPQTRGSKKGNRQVRHAAARQQIALATA